MSFPRKDRHEVNRFTNVQHTSRIDGIAAALKALGKRLDMRTV